MRAVGCESVPVGRLRCVAAPGYVPSKVRPFMRPRRRSCGGGVRAPRKLCAPFSTFVCASERKRAGIGFVPTSGSPLQVHSHLSWQRPAPMMESLPRLCPPSIPPLPLTSIEGHQVGRLPRFRTLP